MDLLGGLDAGPPTTSGGAAAPQVGGMAGGLDDLLGGVVAAPPAAPAGCADEVVLDSATGGGMEIRSAFAVKNGQPFQQLTFTNGSPSPLSSFAIQYNKNTYGLAPDGQNALGQNMPPTCTRSISHGIGTSNLLVAAVAACRLQGRDSDRCQKQCEGSLLQGHV